MTENTENSDEPLIDPEVKEELEDIPGEDPALVEYAMQGGEDNEDISFAESWFPDTNNWKGKTNITVEQAKMMSIARNLDEHYSEMEELMPFINGVVDDYEQYLTSIAGESREQQAGILRSLFGGSSEMEEVSKSAALQAFAQTQDDE